MYIARESLRPPLYDILAERCSRDGIDQIVRLYKDVIESRTRLHDLRHLEKTGSIHRGDSEVTDVSGVSATAAISSLVKHDFEEVPSDSTERGVDVLGFSSLMSGGESASGRSVDEK